jgi:hypothetical protein
MARKTKDCKAFRRDNLFGDIRSEDNVRHL